eukprot:CAMPEP_0114590006 /NCGR_PEP_ID=MMETSP0125-20121206/12331_1 /TAXON_ID=485358 ORGANISM="Aristerostoma sp., Strain ATCC 50986" /NCGR_SAMPLE_ID=MMETSP0125 /ASSEMBLY_ACC=CAM_ASM_000245 /LENGTH=90 /DNA_ID=CAMNT_0001787215 /DNA_START=314 /DNA_END=586 /DNA_ORIENTATION=-
MEEGFIFGMMVQYLRVFGGMTESISKEDWSTQMVITMKDNGLMIRQKAMEPIIIMMVLNTKGSGKKICNMVLARKFGLMVPNTKDITLKA